jgi:tetratricopeptide (TPR) repeat protein
LWRGRIRSETGEKAAALPDLRTALSRRPGDPYLHHWLGWNHFELGEYALAESVYRGEVSRAPRYWGGHEDLGYLFYALGRYPEAVEVFRFVADLVPDHAPTYNYLGALYFAQENWEDATRMFEKSFAMGRSYFACANLGTLYYMQERFEDAVKMYVWAREYKPDGYLLLGNLASARYWISGVDPETRALLEQAISLAKEALARSPRDGVICALLAGYYSVLLPDSARAYAEEALRLEPENPETLFRTAQAYEQLGERERALTLLGGAIDRGYSRKEIGAERQFRDLRTDPRYALLIPEDGSDSTEQDR